MNNKFSRIVCGFLSVVMCIFSTVHVTNIRAEEVENIPVYNDAIDVTALSVALERDGNFVEINRWTQVEDGDNLSLDFEWTARGTEQPPLTFVYDLSSVLQNISLDNQVIPTADATYRIEGQTLYIDIAKGKSGRSGTCQLSGTIDLSNAEVDEGGITEIKFINKVLEAYAPGKVAGVGVHKQAIRCEADGSGQYYQYFTVKVSNNSDDISVSGATFTDKFASDDNLFADGALFEEFTMTDSAGNPVTVKDENDNTLSSDVAVGTTIKLPELAAQDYVTISYKVKVDKDAALSMKDGANTATVEFNNSTATGSARANPDIPVVSKTGNLDQNNKDKITYTITVDPGTMVDDSTSFVIIDTPDGLDPSLVAGCITGASVPDGMDYVSIPMSAMGDPDQNGVYKLTYTVELPDEYKNQVINKNVRNTVSVTFDDTYEYTSTSDIYIPASGNALLNKSVESYDYDTGVINWKVDLFIPNDISETNTLNSFVLSDWLNGYLDSSLGVQGYSYFDEKGETETLAKAEAVFSGIKISAVGENQTVLNEVPVIDVITYVLKTAISDDGNPWNDDYGYNLSDTNKGKFSTLKFSDEFLDNNAGKTVTLTYSTTMDKSVDGYKSLTYLNTAELSYSFTDGGNTIQSSAHVSPVFNVVKATNYPQTSNPNAIRWVIRLNSLKYDFDNNEVIKVSDILPEGYEIVPGSHGINIASYQVSEKDDFTYGPDNTYGNNSLECNTSTAQDGRQKLDFTLTLTESMASKISKTGDALYLAIVFEAAMTDEYYEEFNAAHTTGEPVDITNEATVTIDSKDYSASCTHQVTPVLPDGVLSKSVVSEKRNLTTDTFDAQYKIVVNEGGAQLLENASQLVLTDTLGTWLELVENSVSITPAADYSYDKTSRTITFNLADKQEYVITYSVTGDCAKFKQLNSDETGIDSSYADEMFSNTVTLKGGNEVNYNQSVQLQEGTYKTNATYQYNVVLSGEKSWNGSSAIIPKNVVINLKETKLSPEGEITVNNTKQELTVENTDGKWTYTIEGLTSKDADGNRYTYEIVEVKVGGDTIENSGYTVTYVNAGSVDTNEGEELTINFTNEFTADDMEIGKLVVNKVWDDAGNANRPDVKFVLKNTTTNDTWEKELGNGTSVTFDNLPLYAYTRDAYDKLVRTPYVYVLSELTVAGGTVEDYDIAYSENNIILASADDIPTTENEQPTKTVTVTNTYEAPLPDQEYDSIPVTKVWEDNNNEYSLRPGSITFVLKADGEVFENKTVTGTTAEFINLPVYKVENGVVTDTKVVYSVEEAAIEGYDISYSGNTGIVLKDGIADSVTVTNTLEYTIEKGSVSVIKEWQNSAGVVDASNDSSVNVTLSADGNVVGTKQATRTTAATFENLPLYKYSRDNNGNIIETDITYTVTEETVSGYTTSYKLDGSDLDAGFTLTANTVKNVTVVNKKAPRAQEYDSIPVTKVWEDNNNEYSLRPSSITFVLKADGEVFESKTVTGTTAEFINLPVYKVENGIVTDTKVVYSVEEAAIEGYDDSYSGNIGIVLKDGIADSVTVTNTFSHIIKTGEVVVKKVWQDSDGNTDNTIDTAVTVTLYADGNAVGTETVTRTTDAHFDNLPVYKYSRDNNGNIEETAIRYTISEAPVSGYVTSYAIEVLELNGSFDLETLDTRTITVTNKKESPNQKHGSVKVTKVWDDDNAGNLKATSITVVLSSDDGAGERTATITSPGTEFTFENLPVFKMNGNTVTNEKVTYTLTEKSVSGYSIQYTGNENIQLSDGGIAEVTVKNTFTHAPEPGSITVNKVWLNENDGPLTITPPTISVTLSNSVNNDTVLKEITPGNTSVSFDDLPVYESYTRNANGDIIGVNAITYYVTETAVTGYETTYSVSPSTGLNLVSSSTGEVTITNKKKPVILGSVKVTKTWDDTANTANIPHPEITVALMADGNQVDTKTIAVGDTTAIFENLPVYQNDGSTKIQYKVVEQTVSGYTPTYSINGTFVLDDNAEKSVEITNIFDYDMKKGDISVTKKWVDSDDSDLVINDTINVVIKADGTEVASDTITGSATKTFNDLPLHKYTRNNDGSITETDITYTVVETNAVSGYTVSYTLDGSALQGGFKLTADDTRAVVITNKKIAVVTTPESSQSSQSSSSSSSSTTPTESSQISSSSTTPTESSQSSSSTTTPTESSQSSLSSTTPTESSHSSSSTTTTSKETSPGTSGTIPSYTYTTSGVQATTTVKNTTTTTVAEDEEEDETTTVADEEDTEETTAVDEDTDTTKPADSEDYEEDDSDEDEMYDEDGDIDDYIGSDTDFDSNIEENPHTSLTINFGYALAFAFGTYAFFPRKKKKN